MAMAMAMEADADVGVDAQAQHARHCQYEAKVNRTGQGKARPGRPGQAQATGYSTLSTAHTTDQGTAQTGVQRSGFRMWVSAAAQL